MSQTTVVNQMHTRADVFIGRAPGPKGAFGNPFTAKPTKLPWAVPVDDAKTACRAFEAWLSGDDPDIVFAITKQTWLDFLPERRFAILKALPDLHGQSLGCFCVSPRNRYPDCHGFVLARWADISFFARKHKEDKTPTGWTHDQIRALGWLSEFDIYPSGDGWAIKPWRSNNSTWTKDLNVAAALFGGVPINCQTCQTASR